MAGEADDKGQGNGDLSLDNPQVKELAEKYANEKFGSVQSELEKLRADHKALSDRTGGIDIDRARELLDADDKGRLENHFKNGDYEKALTEQTEKVKAGYQAKLDEALATNEALAKERDDFKGRITAGEIARAASEAGVHPAAVDDVIARIGAGFTVSNDGKIAAVDGNIDSKGSAMTVKGALEALKVSAPHLFVAGTGTGASGSKSGGAPVAGKKRSEMTATERVQYISEHGDENYRKLPL